MKSIVLVLGVLLSLGARADRDRVKDYFAFELIGAKGHYQTKADSYRSYKGKYSTGKSLFEELSKRPDKAPLEDIAAVLQISREKNIRQEIDRVAKKRGFDKFYVFVQLRIAKDAYTLNIKLVKFDDKFMARKDFEVSTTLSSNFDQGKFQANWHYNGTRRALLNKIKEIGNQADI